MYEQKKPKAHSPPQKEMPTRPRLRHMGMDIFRWPHSAALSPVHTAPADSSTPAAHSLMVSVNIANDYMYMMHQITDNFKRI